MSAVATADEEIYDSGFGKLWWLFLITGTAWLVLSLIMFRFDITSVKSIGILAGIVFLFAAAFEFMLVAVVRGGWWKALNAILGVLLLVRRDLRVRPPVGRVHRDRLDHRLHVPARRDHGSDHRVLEPHRPLVAADDLRLHLHRARVLGVGRVRQARRTC